MLVLDIRFCTYFSAKAYTRCSVVCLQQLTYLSYYLHIKMTDFNNLYFKD